MTTSEQIDDLRLAYYRQKLGITDGQINDLLLRYYRRETGRDYGAINDLISLWLTQQGYTEGASDFEKGERWMRYLGDLGYVGDIKARFKSFYSNLGRVFYFDLDAGSDGDGSFSSPYNSTKYLNNPNATVGVDGYDGIIPEDFDTYCIKGKGVGANSTIFISFAPSGSHVGIRASNVTIQGWPGFGKFELSTILDIPLWNKTATYTNVYEFDMTVYTGFPGTPSVFQVAYDYAGFETPGTNGKLTPASVWMVQQALVTDLATTLTTLDGAPGKWYFHAATKKLYIHAPGSADPNGASNPVKAFYYDTTITTPMFSVRTPTTANGCSGWTVQDIIVSGYTIQGRSIEVLDSDDFELKNFEVWYAGDDAVAFAGGGARNAYIHDGFIAGQNQRSGAINADTGVVLFTDHPTIKMENNIVEKVKLHYFDLLTTAGAVLHPAAGAGFSTHSSNAKEGMAARGVVWKNCELYCYGSATSPTPISADSCLIPTNIYDPDTYGVVFEDCRIYECRNITTIKNASASSGGGQIAFKRCYIHSVGSASQQINHGAGNTFYDEFCVWEFEDTGTCNITFGQALGDGRKHRWVTRNSLFLNGSSTAAVGIFTISGTAITDGIELHVDGSVFYRYNTSTGRWFRAGTGAALFDLTGSSTQINLWLMGMTVPLFGVADSDTVAEFITKYDPGAQCLFAVNPDIQLSTDPSILHEYVPIQDGAIATRTRPGTPTTRTGIDSETDTGRWGPWQGDYTS